MSRINMRILTLITCGNMHTIKMYRLTSREGAKKRDWPQNVSILA